MRRIAQSMTLLRQRAGGNELPDVEAGHRVCAAPCNRAGTSLYAAPTFSICSTMDSACFRLASDQMIHPLSPEQRHAVLGSINLLNQPLRGSNGLSHFGRRSLWRAPMPAGAWFANRVLVAAAGRRFFRSPTTTPHHERAEVSNPVRSTKPCRRQCMRTHCSDGASPAAGRQAVAGLSSLAGGLRMRDKPRPLAPGSTF